MAFDLRPLAVVMVADPTPLTLANLRNLAQWCDLVLTEGTTTTSGDVREPLRNQWREVLGLASPELRIITTDLAGRSPWLRQRIQRDSVLPLLLSEPDDRPVLMVDADELLDPAAVQDRITGGLADPVRLGLVPLYGAVDRVAKTIHCCWRDGSAKWRAMDRMPKQEYIFAASSLATAGAMRGRSPSAVRFRSPLETRERLYGVHATLTEPAEQVAWKLANMRHVWDPRSYRVGHLDTMLRHGVHHAGWWVAGYRKPEAELLDLAESAGLRVAGEPGPDDHLRALRAWAQARLDPRVPEELVEAGDRYAADRRPDAEDFLPALDDYLLQHEVEFNGHAGGEDVVDHGGFVQP